MEPKGKRVKFNLCTETVIIPSAAEESADCEQPQRNVTAHKVIQRRSSVDCEEKISGMITSDAETAECVQAEDVISNEPANSETRMVAKGSDIRAQFMADENEWTEKYKKSSQQYTFINPLPHGKREETFPCLFRLEGCSYASDRIRTAVHNRSCDYRPVICTVSEECGLIPFTKYLNHIEEKHEATGMSSGRHWWFYEQSVNGGILRDMRLPIYIRQYDGQTFLLNTQIVQSKAHWWMTMHGELNKISNYCTSVRILPTVDRKSTDDFLKSSDLDVYLSRQVTLNNIPKSNFGVEWEDLCDYLYKKPRNRGDSIYWRIKVTIKKRKPRSNLALFTMGKEIKEFMQLKKIKLPPNL